MIVRACALATTLSLTIPPLSLAGERPPFLSTTGYLRAAGEAHAITGQCAGDPPYDKVACTFGEVIVERDKSAEDTCVITVIPFRADFRRVAPRKWASNPAPEGVCRVVYATTLEYLEERDLLPQVTVTTTVGNHEDPVCRGAFPTDPPRMVFTWMENLQRTPRTCKYVRFGI